MPCASGASGHSLRLRRQCHAGHPATRRPDLQSIAVCTIGALSLPTSGSGCRHHLKRLLLVNSTRDDASLAARLEASEATLVCFPRSFSKNDEYSIPDALPPGHLQSLINVRVVRTETLPDNCKLIAKATDTNKDGSLGAQWTCRKWREHIDSPLKPLAHFDDGWGFHYCNAKRHYINAIPEQASLVKLISQLSAEAGLQPFDLGTDLRTRQRGSIRLAFNYGPTELSLDEKLGGKFGLSSSTPLIFGSRNLEPAGVAAWRVL